MSFSFRFKYLLGIIPSAKKIDSDWSELFKVRDELHQIESSKELTRYHELKNQIQSNDFQTEKQTINNLCLKGSHEGVLLDEYTALGHSKPIRDYFKFKTSPDFGKLEGIAKSPQLMRYFELKKIVESPEFIHRKKEVVSLVYSGSPESIKRTELNTLQKSAQLKHYYTTKASDEYRLFLELEASEKGKLKDPSKVKDPKIKTYYKFLNSKAYENLKTVEQLGLPVKLEQLKQETNTKPFLEREAFLKNKKRFETTPDYQTFHEFSELSKSDDISFYIKRTKSALYENFKKTENSEDLNRLLELKALVEDPKFVQQVAFLRNKKRYQSTPAYELEKEFGELSKNKTITTYHQLKKRPELAFFHQWEILMNENFENNKFTTAIWEPENYWGSKLAGCSFSQANELQAYNGLKNIEFRNKTLSIVTKADKLEGKVWNPSIGLMPQKFDYSSAILNTGNGFRFKEGVVETKVKFSGEKAITSALSLTGSHPFPQIDLFRSGNNSVGVGIIDQPGKEGLKSLVQIKGLNFSNFHVFRLEIFGNQIVWKINNFEVHRQHVTKNPGELFLNFVGSLHEPLNGGSLPHHFEIEWVKFLKKK